MGKYYSVNKYLIYAVLVFIFSCGNRIAFETPESAVRYFWQSLAYGDQEAVLQTQIYYRNGMSSEFIITPQHVEWLYLDNLTTVYESPTRARVYYQVVMKSKNSAKITRYKTGTMSIKLNDSWRVGRIIGAEDGKSH